MKLPSTISISISVYRPTWQSHVFSFSPFSPFVFSFPDNTLNQKHPSIHSVYVIYETVFQKYSFEEIITE